jgi:hypothetical protein
MGLAPAKSLPERVAYGYSTLSAVQFAAANATEAGELSADDAKAVLKIGDEARALLDGAKAMASTDPAGANDKLILATTVLTNLQAYLRSHQK